MPNLFIIGNGFDLAHGLPTRYSKFREFLRTKYGADEYAYLVSPSPQGDGFGNVWVDSKEVANLVARMLRDACADELRDADEDEYWSDFENALGYFDYVEFFEDAKEYDRDGDIHPAHTFYNVEDIADNLLFCIPHIKDLFQEWIGTIDISAISPKPHFAEIINPSADFFLTFNYTSTLATIYGCQNICHIHGKQGTDIYVGHGDDNVACFDDAHYGSEEDLKRLKQALRKDTQKALSLHQGFFDELAAIDSVYSIGFSYSCVDLVYIEKICRIAGSKISKWVFDTFRNEYLNKHFDEHVRNCGYTGKFDAQKLV